MHQVELIMQVETDEQLDRAIDYLAIIAMSIRTDANAPAHSNLFVADDLGLVIRP